VKNILLVLLLFFPDAQSAAQPVADHCRLQTIRGWSTRLSHIRKQKPMVLAFLSPDCPICIKYTRTLQQLSEAFPSVRFVAVFHRRTTRAQMRHFQQQWPMNIPLYRDKKHRLTHRMGVRMNPEVVLLDTRGEIRYSGGIDNWFVAPGENRPAPTVFYLKNALEALLSGHEIDPKHSPAVGCIIER
jgi:thiol-disulfide isomerase/thioredoxin